MKWFSLILLLAVAIEAAEPGSLGVAVVSIGDSDLGPVTVRKLVNDGWKVAVIGPISAGMESLQLEYKTNPLVWIETSATDKPGAIRSFLDNSTAKLGPITAVFDNTALHEVAAAAQNQFQAAKSRGTIIRIEQPGSPSSTLPPKPIAKVEGVQNFLFRRTTVENTGSNSVLDVAKQLVHLNAFHHAFDDGAPVDGTTVRRRMAGVPSGFFPPSAAEGVHDDLERTLKALPVPPWAGLAEISVDGRSLARPRSLVEAYPFLDALHDAIRNGRGATAVVQIGERVLRIDRMPLGEGGTGIVYAVNGDEQVLKLARPHSIGLMSLRKEQDKAVEVAAVLTKAGFHTPGDLLVDKVGIFAIRDRIRGESLTELLLRKGLVNLQKDGDRLVVKRAPIEQIRVLAADPEVGRLLKNIEGLMAARRQNPHLSLDLGPDNLVFQKVPSSATPRIVLVDIGPAGPTTRATFDAAEGPEGYLAVAAGLIERNITNKVLPLAPLVAKTRCPYSELFPPR